jgi:hypothetical protein
MTLDTKEPGAKAVKKDADGKVLKLDHIHN